MVKRLYRGQDEEDSRITGDKPMGKVAIHEPDAARERRAHVIYKRYAREILNSFKGNECWVPGTHNHHKVLITRKRAHCSCEDHGYNHYYCAHLLAAERVKRESAICEECGKRFRHRDLYEVMESETYYEGMKLCVGCVAISDAEVS